MRQSGSCHSRGVLWSVTWGRERGLLNSIEKAGYVVIRAGLLLTVRKRGTTKFILPGGKLEGRETAEQALLREIREELGCDCVEYVAWNSIDTIDAFHPERHLRIHLFLGEVRPEPRVLAELAELRWLNCVPTSGMEECLVPSLSLTIVPMLLEAGLLDGGG